MPRQVEGKAKEVKLGRAVLEESVIGVEGKAALGTAVANGTLPLLDHLWVKSWAGLAKTVAGGDDSPLDAFAAKMGTTVAAIKSSYYLDWSHKRLNSADCLAIAQLAADGAFGKAKEVGNTPKLCCSTGVVGTESRKATCVTT